MKYIIFRLDWLATICQSLVIGKKCAFPVLLVTGFWRSMAVDVKLRSKAPFTQA